MSIIFWAEEKQALTNKLANSLANRLTIYKC